MVDCLTYPQTVLRGQKNLNLTSGIPDSIGLEGVLDRVGLKSVGSSKPDTWPQTDFYPLLVTGIRWKIMFRLHIPLRSLDLFY